ncbi:DEP domain-containing protein 1A-like isoform X2 [Corticium candelabrum]|uniref:DEP domain-containing protein 1A-like isoform X2 n=1 Tax=Corticium candelabrum TaxID=121492 RepID=UPI002E26CADC|nr:DEP domain-containing protein 1A-like isoform X2 [Corticium candelabrum]
MEQLTSQLPKPKFKATRLWNELVRNLREGVELKRHRWHMKTYDDCFTGSDAIECLLRHMQWTGTFGHVTRPQAAKLCQKFLEMRVIVDARGKQEKNEFRDGNHLYKFTQPLLSPRKRPARSALSTVVVANTYARMEKTPAKKAKMETNCFDDSEVSEEQMDRLEPMVIENKEAGLVEIRQIDMGDATPEEVAAVWKEITLSRLLQLVDMHALEDVLKVQTVNGKHIAANANHIVEAFMSMPRCTDRDKLFELTTNADVLPHWVLSAMEFLKNWPYGAPEQCGFTLPVYRGFDRDVLTTIEEYFQSMPQPLIPTELFSLHTAIIGLIQSGKQTSVDALQLSTLLVSPLSRAQLLKLLMFMDSVTHSQTISLSTDRSNRQVLVKLFGSVILRSCSKPSVLELESVSLLVNFLLDNYTQIFTIPVDIEERVKQRLEHKSKDETDVAMVVGLSCHQITQQHYLNQMRETSQQAIAQLLDTIMENEKMSSKQKKQKLKQFQKAHPEIFSRKFPDGCPFLSQQQKPRRRSSLKLKSSFKLKSRLR